MSPWLAPYMAEPGPNDVASYWDWLPSELKAKVMRVERHRIAQMLHAELTEAYDSGETVLDAERRRASIIREHPELRPPFRNWFFSILCIIDEPGRWPHHIHTPAYERRLFRRPWEVKNSLDPLDLAVASNWSYNKDPDSDPNQDELDPTDAIDWFYEYIARPLA